MPKRYYKSKVCTRCGERKLLINFYKSKKHYSDGRSTRCKVCLRQTSREYGTSKTREHSDWPIVHCDFCGNPFRRSPTTLKGQKNHFCNRRCEGKHRRKKLKVFCLSCNKIIYKKPSIVKNKKSKSFFCSPECKVDWRKKSMFFIPCQCCGKALYKSLKVIFRQKLFFCNQECWHEWGHSVKSKGKHYKCNGRMIECSTCGKPLYRSGARLRQGKNYFCNDECQGIWASENLVGEFSPTWQGGKSFEPYGTDFGERLKEAIRLQDGHKCQKCGLPELLNSRKLLVHHIDYNKKNCKPGNLITLCDKCNNTVNFRRPYWTKFFIRKLQQRKIQQKGMQLHLRFSGKREHKRSRIAAPFGYQRNPANEFEFLPVQDEQEIIRVMKILQKHCFFFPEIAGRLNGWSNYFSHGNRTKPVSWRGNHIQNILRRLNGHKNGLQTAFHLKSIPAGLLTELPSDNGNSYIKARRQKISIAKNYFPF